jgi:hypothetical protein
MPGQNLFRRNLRRPLGKGAALAAVLNKPCVFISHKREDADMAQAVADTLVEMNVDVWLDLDELKLPPPKTAADHLELTEAIETGLQSSTHLLALITPRTRDSWWVPFEIGSCRALRKGLAFLLHRDVPNLPSYMVVGDKLIDKDSLCLWAEKLAKQPGTVSVLASVQMNKLTNIDKYLLKQRA